MKRIVLILLFAFHYLLATDVQSHEARPVFVEITETITNEFSAWWKVPTTVPVYSIPYLIMPDTCRAQGETVELEYPEAYVRQQQYHCLNGLSGQVLALEFEVFNPSVSSLFRVQLLNGEIHNHIMQPGETKWRVPDKENILGVVRDYLLLGIRHIFTGADHLLFVACLIFIARTARRILITISGFTLAHSLTLALSTLRIVELPVPPVEAGIALSILFLAHEIAVKNRQSWTWRYPITVSSSFGLLHGFGFAAVLRDIGLPQTELPAALLFFNLGVELGQILFVGVVAVAIFALSRLSIKRELVQRHRLYAQAAVYAIGSISAFWFIERVIKFWI